MCCAAAIKEAEVCHTTATCILQQTHRENMLMLQCKAKAEDGWDHKAFVEVFGAALQACPPKTHGTLMYPLQLLASDVPLATILERMATTQLQAVADKEPMLVAPIPSASQMPAPQEGGKCWHHSSDLGQGEEETVELDNTL